MAHDPNTKLPLDITGDDNDYTDDDDDGDDEDDDDYPNFTQQPFTNFGLQ